MSIFDQRGQQVTYQYNANGDINFGAVRTQSDVIGEIRKLQLELVAATEQKALTGETAIDAESAVKKAVLEAEQPKPSKTTLIEHLNSAKKLVAGVSGLAEAFANAVEKVKVLF